MNREERRVLIALIYQVTQFQARSIPKITPKCLELRPLSGPLILNLMQLFVFLYAHLGNLV